MGPINIKVDQLTGRLFWVGPPMGKLIKITIVFITVRILILKLSSNYD